MCKRLVCLTTLASLLALAVAGRADAADPNLAGWWKLDGDATDSSGNGIHGTINGDPQWVAGVVGGAGSFDGVDDWIDLGNPPSLPSGKAPRSVCAWALTNSLGSAWAIVAGYGATGTGQGNGLGRQGTALSAFGMGTAVRVENFWQVGVWYHLCMTFDGTVGTLYANGVPLLSQEKPDWNLVLNRARIGRQINDNPEFWIGLIDDVRFYSRALTDRDIQAVMRGVGQEQAIAPQPQSEAVDVPRDVVMSWTASEFAATHDVYFGTAFEDVNSASRANPLNAPVSRGQEANTYDPGRLEFGQTYYWRIDEVNAPPDNTIFKGEVWSFTVEPIAYPIAPASIIATASSSNSNDEDPNKTIDRSGLDPDDLHSAENADMWLSGTSEPQSAWIQYEFDRAYKLHEMWVWNHNTLSEATVGFGIKDAVIQYSADGLEWVTLGTTHEFARAPGAPGYAHNTVVDFGDVVVRCVKITANSNWRGILEQYGLSEVRFLYVPVWAREASPDSGAADVAVDATLGWRAGREAAGHEVYVSTDQQAVADGNAPVQAVASPSYTPALDVDSTYYWRVDEVNESETPSVWPGDVWSFSTAEYVVVDDFESYTNASPKRVFQTWVDGLGFSADEFFPVANTGNGTGAMVGYDPATGNIMETTVKHAGGKSMPLEYDNATATSSEATRTFAGPQDWTRHGVKALTLWFYGDPANAAQQMYVKVNSAKALYDGDIENLKRKQWQMWYIDLTSLNVGSVTSLSIGFDRIAGAGGQGLVLIDDIRLYSHDRQLVTPVNPGTANLQAYYPLDGNANDSSGKARHGTAMSSPSYVAGKVGQAISLDGYDDYVTITGYKGILADAAGVQQPFTVCCWIKTATNARDIVAWGKNVAGQRMNLRVDTVLRVEHGNGNVRGTNGPSLLDDEWHHVAATVPQGGRIMDVRLYVDGVDVTPASTTTAAFNLTANTDVAIGMAGPAGGRFFTGLIDDARLYDRVLSLEEIVWLTGRTMPFDKSF